MFQKTLKLENLLYEITSRIRQSLDLKEVLSTAVREIQAFLDVDRVKIYRFEPEGHGEVVAESIKDNNLPSLLGLHFPARDLPRESRRLFIQARQRVIVDVESQRKTVQMLDSPDAVDSLAIQDTCYAPVDPCHVEYLQSLGVASSLVVPILYHNQLWGLLVIHHSQPHRFSEQTLQFIQLLVDQVSIAIAQANLLLQVKQQVDYEATVNQISSLLHCPMNVSEIRQTVLEEAVTALQGSGGRLYLFRATESTSAQLYTWGEQPTEAFIEEDPLWHVLISQPADCVLPSDEHQEPLIEIRERTTRSRQARQSFSPSEDLIDREAVNSGKSVMACLVDDLVKPELQPLHEAFAPTPIKSILIVPLQYDQQCIGYLSVFRNGYDAQILWAGRDNADLANRRPRQSFEAWCEIKTNQSKPWTAEDIKLAQAIGVHVYMSVMQKRVEAMLRHQASHDRLTNLPNRLLFEEQLTLSLVNVHRNGDILAVAFLDLDRFKTVNDTLGHAIGDQLLKQVTERLQHCLRSCDLVARWGGDEFTMLFPRIHCSEDISQISDRILDELSHPFHLDNQDLYVTASLGIALAPYDGEDTATLLKHADTAMYQAKQQGRNNCQLYFPEMNVSARDRLSLEADLRKALTRHEFLLYYQPQLDIKTRAIVGVEALIRWQHPKLGLVPPYQFIPIAEETGLIGLIGEWVIETACLQHRQWCQAGFPPIRIAINVSARQFQQSALVNTIVEILQKTEMNPNFLEIEITESTAMQDRLLSIAVLNELRQMGIQTAIDDFGTGYSSLSAIKHLPFDTLKIDRSFTRDLMTDPSDAAIATAIVALGQGLKLRTLAEGVETQDQLEFLQSIGCDCAQGFLFSKPLPVAEISTLLKGWCSTQ